MAGIGYLLGRLPPLVAATTQLPIGPETFSDLVIDEQQRRWATGLLDWLRIANYLSVLHKRPPPYPEAKARPLLAWPDDAFGAYYRYFGAIGAPGIVREWALEDSASIAARAAASSRDTGVVSQRALNPRLESLILPPDGLLDRADARDRNTEQMWFEWLDEQLFSASPDSEQHIYAYAIKLLILVRGGRRLHRDAA